MPSLGEKRDGGGGAHTKPIANGSHLLTRARGFFLWFGFAEQFTTEDIL